MANRLFNLLAAACAIACALIAVAWYAAGGVDPRRQFLTLSGACYVSIDARGMDARLEVFNTLYGPYHGGIVSMAASGSRRSPIQPRVSGVGDVAGIYYRMIRWPNGPRFWTLSLSLAYPLMLVAFPPALWILRRSRRARRGFPIAISANLPPAASNPPEPRPNLRQEAKTP